MSFILAALKEKKTPLYVYIEMKTVFKLSYQSNTFQKKVFYEGSKAQANPNTIQESVILKMTFLTGCLINITSEV